VLVVPVGKTTGHTSNLNALPVSLDGGRGLKAVPHVNPRLSDNEGLVHAITCQPSVRCEAGRRVSELSTVGTQNQFRFPLGHRVSIVASRLDHRLLLYATTSHSHLIHGQGQQAIS
jgi:hypothetical protein